MVSLIAEAVSAVKDNYDPSWGSKNQTAYFNAYYPISEIGYNSGKITDIPME
jgi:hypothetical protein